MDKIDQSKLRERLVDCFKRTHVQTEGDTELFDTEVTIDNLMALFSEALKEAETKGRVAELKKIEPFTHNGRGTILWEMDELATRIKSRLAALQPKTGEEKDE